MIWVPLNHPSDLLEFPDKIPWILYFLNQLIQIASDYFRRLDEDPMVGAKHKEIGRYQIEILASFFEWE